MTRGPARFPCFKITANLLLTGAVMLVAGAAMGLSGCLVQTLIRNRLATPDMIGVNEGASLAIIIFSLYLTLGSWRWWAAPFGALFAAAIIRRYGLPVPWRAMAATSALSSGVRR